MARLIVSLLGPFQATLDGKPVTGFESSKVRGLLAYLAAEMKRPHARETLAELLWPDQPAGAALGNLRNALANLRTALQDRSAQPPFLLISHDTLQLNPQAGVFVDLDRFNVLAGLDRPCSPDECRQAVELARGEFLEGLKVEGSPGFEEWAAVMGEQVNRRLVRVLARRIRGSVEHGDYVHAVSWTRRQLALQPWNEEIHRQLIWLLAVSGQRTAALRQAEACRHILAEELDVEPEQETELLAERIRSGQGDLGAVHGQDGELLVLPGETLTRKHNLPALTVPFFGREKELAQVAALLASPQCRLLTIAGPGGVGKTRLALEAAAQQIDRFAGGVFVVFLAAVVQGEMLAGEILRALEAAASGAANPEQRLRDYLSDKEMLLVLDNFEQLASRGLYLADLLAAAPRLKILVTSRQRLRLSVEWLAPLEGLDLPDLPEPPAPNAALAAQEASSLERYSAVELFVHAGRRANPSFALTDENAGAVARICRLLDGFPLALELSAAWVRVLPVAEVLAELQRSPALLETTLSDVPERHRSMETVFDRSWSLLTPREQGLLRRLSVFRGGFTRAGAQEVAGASVVDLAALADKSWLRSSAAGRYGMHELVRQYCEERLEADHEAADGESPAGVRRRHCAYIAKIMQVALQKLNFQRDAYDEIVPEVGNLQAAWRYAVEHLDSDAAKQIVFGIWFSADVLGWFTWAIQTLELGAAVLEEQARQAHADARTAHRAGLALAWIRDAQRNQYVHLGLPEGIGVSIEKMDRAAQLLEPGDAKTFWQMQVVQRRGQTAFYWGDYGEAERLERQAQALYADPHIEIDQFYGTPAGLVFFRAEVDYFLAVTQLYLGDYAAARQLFARSIAQNDEIGEGRFKGLHLGRYAQLALITGDLAQAEQLAQEGLRLVESFNDRTNAVRLQAAAGCVAAATGRTAEARGYLRACIETCSQLGILIFHLEALNALGRLDLAQGDIVSARAHFEEAQAVLRQADTAHCNALPGAVLGLGWTALAEGNPGEAQDMFRGALAGKGIAAWETLEAIAGLARILAHEEVRAEAVELLALVAAHRFTAYAMRRQAARWLAELEPGLPPDVYAARLSAGRARDLDAALSGLIVK